MAISKRNLFSASAIYTFGDFMVLGVSGFLLVPIYVRYMTPAEYGLYGTVTTMITLLGVVMMMGFHSATVRFYFIYRQTGEENAYLGSLWLFQIFVSLGLVGIFILFGKPVWRLVAPDVPIDPYGWVVVGGAWLLFASGIYSIWLKGKGKAWALYWCSVITEQLYLWD